jgi:hypothetical protein
MKCSVRFLNNKTFRGDLVNMDYEIFHNKLVLVTGDPLFRCTSYEIRIKSSALV